MITPSVFSTSNTRTKASSLLCCDTCTKRCSIDSTVVWLDSIRTCTGLRKCWLATRLICSGIVAENSASWRSLGVCSRIHSISSMKPIFNISSASSSTKACNESSFKVPRRIWSITRPGVPTITCGPRFRAFNCCCMLWPP